MVKFLSDLPIEFTAYVNGISAKKIIIKNFLKLTNIIP